MKKPTDITMTERPEAHARSKTLAIMIYGLFGRGADLKVKEWHEVGKHGGVRACLHGSVSQGLVLKDSFLNRGLGW